MESMEIALRRGLYTIKTYFKEKIIENIMNNEDVMFNWLMISGEWKMRKLKYFLRW